MKRAHKTMNFRKWGMVAMAELFFIFILSPALSLAQQSLGQALDGGNAVKQAPVVKEKASLQVEGATPAASQESQADITFHVLPSFDGRLGPGHAPFNDTESLSPKSYCPTRFTFRIVNL